MIPMTRGVKAADAVASFMGSWAFVIAQSIFLALWFLINSLGVWFAWDAYPFILANLFMSAQAAFATPLILMSQNRTAEADRRILHQDYAEDKETNILVERIADKLGVERNGNPPEC